MDKGLDFTLNIILTFDNLRNFVILVKISCILKENGHLKLYMPSLNALKRCVFLEFVNYAILQINAYSKVKDEFVFK